MLCMQIIVAPFHSAPTPIHKLVLLVFDVARVRLMHVHSVESLAHGTFSVVLVAHALEYTQTTVVPLTQKRDCFNDMKRMIKVCR